MINRANKAAVHRRKANTQPGERWCTYISHNAPISEFDRDEKVCKTCKAKEAYKNLKNRVR